MASWVTPSKNQSFHNGAPGPSWSSPITCDLISYYSHQSPVASLLFPQKPAWLCLRVFALAGSSISDARSPVICLADPGPPLVRSLLRYCLLSDYFCDFLIKSRIYPVLSLGQTLIFLSYFFPMIVLTKQHTTSCIFFPVCLLPLKCKLRKNKNFCLYLLSLSSKCLE